MSEPMAELAEKLRARAARTLSQDSTSLDDRENALLDLQAADALEASTLKIYPPQPSGSDLRASSHVLSPTGCKPVDAILEAIEFGHGTGDWEKVQTHAENAAEFVSYLQMDKIEVYWLLKAAGKRKRADIAEVIAERLNPDATK